jgi:hypothetical protein
MRALRHLAGEEQENSDFVPMEDRWRIGLPEYDRYGQGTRRTSNIPSFPAASGIRITRTCSRGTIRSWDSTTSST